jgi:hypothetical protein
MLETIPLTTALCIDMDFIIETAVIELMCQVNDFLLELLTSETRKLEVVQSPI